jgi:hypothetical protein
MATELWQQARMGAARILCARDDQAERAMIELLGRPASESGQVESGLRALLGYQLRQDPAVAEQFAALVRELSGKGAAQPGPRINQQATVGQNGFSIQAGRDAHVKPGSWLTTSRRDGESRRN